MGENMEKEQWMKESLQMQKASWIQDEITKRIPIGLYAFSGQYGTDWSALMAATAISIIPGVIFYIIFQKSLVEGISLTGMGGR